MSYLTKHPKELNTVKVQIGGCELKLKTNHDDATCNKIVKTVEKQLQIVQTQQSLPINQVLALSCLNMAEELVCLKELLSKQLGQLELKAKSALSELESSSTA